MAEEQGKQYGQLIAKAWSDEEFKARLLANPKDAMAEVGMDVPEGVEIEVVESTQEKVYLIIPPKPDGELSDDDLDKVSGGLLSGEGAGRFWGEIFCGGDRDRARAVSDVIRDPGRLFK